MKEINDSPRMADDHFNWNDVMAEGYDRHALNRAKAPQEKSQAEFNRWIAVAIAELATE